MQPLGNKLLLVIFLLLLLDNYGDFRSVLTVNPTTKLARMTVIYIIKTRLLCVCVCVFVCLFVRIVLK